MLMHVYTDYIIFNKAHKYGPINRTYTCGYIQAELYKAIIS